MKAFAAERASAVLPSSGVVSGFLESKKNQSERPADFSSLQTATLPHGRKWMPATSTTVSFRLSRILVHPHSRTSAAAYYQLYRKLPASKMVSKCYHCANNKVASGGGVNGKQEHVGDAGRQGGSDEKHVEAEDLQDMLPGNPEGHRRRPQCREGRHCTRC